MRFIDGNQIYKSNCLLLKKWHTLCLHLFARPRPTIIDFNFMNSAFDLDAAADDEKKAASLSFKLTLWKSNFSERCLGEDGDAAEEDQHGRVPGYRVDRRGIVRARLQESCVWILCEFHFLEIFH